MILTGTEIQKEFNAGNITISSFAPERVTTNSYDLSLSDELLFYTDDVLDPTKKPNYKTVKIGPEGILLEKGTFCLGSSKEKIGSDKYVPILHAKSGVARVGLFVHCTADLIDIGSHGNITFQLYATLPIRLYPGMLLGQVSFWVPKGKIVLYTGKYQSSEGAQVTKSWQDS